MRFVTGMVAILTSLLMCGAVIAQADAPKDANAGAGVAETAQGTGGIPTNFDEFLESFSNPDFSSVMGGIASSMHFNIVKLSQLQNADKARLDEAIAPHTQVLTELRAVLAESDRAEAALDAEDVTVDQVVWISGEGENVMNLYVADF